MMRSESELYPAPRRYRRALDSLVLTLSIGALLAVPLRGMAQEQTRTIQVSGVVSDAAGVPLPEVTVVFQAARRGLSLHGLRMETGKTQERRVVTNRRGLYTLRWPYDPFYNHFQVRVEMPIRKADGEHTETLAQSELSGVRSASGPLVANLTVEHADRLRSLKKFLAQIDTKDERAIYQKMGQPEEVDGASQDDGETAWWYFAAGKVYFFRGGKLHETRDFAPVHPF
jgi:hypothetical protein